MRFRVFDLETTGLPEKGIPHNHEVMEAGYTDVVRSTGGVWTRDGATRAQLFEPSRPPEIGAIAAHHIALEDVKGEPSSSTAGGWLHSDPRPEFFAAHNIEYDLQFFDPNGATCICTYKCALWAWPEAPSHSNQALRYYLNLPVFRPLCEPVHRAGPDTYVTAGILIELLKLYEPEQLVEWTKQPKHITKLPMNPHRGKLLSDPTVDYGFLNWVLGKDFDEDLKFAIRAELKRRDEAIAIERQQRHNPSA